jgi:hypothetical protein
VLGTQPTRCRRSAISRRRDHLRCTECDHHSGQLRTMSQNKQRTKIRPVHGVVDLHVQSTLEDRCGGAVLVHHLHGELVDRRHSSVVHVRSPVHFHSATGDRQCHANPRAGEYSRGWEIRDRIACENVATPQAGQHAVSQDRTTRAGVTRTPHESTCHANNCARIYKLQRACRSQRAHTAPSRVHGISCSDTMGR